MSDGFVGDRKWRIWAIAQLLTHGDRADMAFLLGEDLPELPTVEQDTENAKELMRILDIAGGEWDRQAVAAVYTAARRRRDA